MSICNCLINERLVNWCESIDFTGPRVGLALSILVIVLAAKVNEYTQPKLEQMRKPPETFDFSGSAVVAKTPVLHVDFAELLTNYNDVKHAPNFREVWGGIFNHLQEAEKEHIATVFFNEVGNIKELLSAFKDSKGSRSNFSKAPRALKLYDLLTRASLLSLVKLPRAEPDLDDKGKDEGRVPGNFSEIFHSYTRLSQEDQKVFRENWDEIFNGLLEEDQARISQQQLAEVEKIEKCLSILDFEDAADITQQFIMDPAQGIESYSEEVSMMLHDLLVGGALNTCLEAQLVQNGFSYDSE